MAATHYLHSGLICWRECHWNREDPLQAVRLTDIEQYGTGAAWSQTWWCQILDSEDKLFGEEVLINHMNLDATMPPLLQLAYASVI